MAAFQDNVVRPMLGERRYFELCDVIEAKLEAERDEDFRFMLIGELVLYLQLAGDDRSSLDWAVRRCQEFDASPIAWSALGSWHFYSMHPGHPTQDEMLTALKNYNIALRRARSANEWVRYVLFNICRVLADLEEYTKLEATMREILDDLETERENDSPRLEGEWLNRVPEDALDASLLERYKLLEQADAARMKRLGYGTRPATLSALGHDR